MPQGLKDFITKDISKIRFAIVSKMIYRVKLAIRRLQKADKSVKKGYLIIFSAITMAVVVGLWIFYLRVLSKMSLEGSGVFLKNFFIAIGHWLKDIFLKIKLGKVIIIER